MITTPWKAARPAIHRSALCTVFAAHLPVRSRRDLARALWWMLPIRRRLAHTAGLLGHALAVNGCAVWTVSAWTDRVALARFDRSGIHRRAKAALRPVLLPSTFVVWSCPIDELPVAWAEVRSRIAAARAR